MTSPGPDVAHRFASAFNVRDVEQVLGCFTSDAVYHDLFYGRFSSRAGLRRLFERMYSEGEQHVWTMMRVVENPVCTIGEWHFTFTVSGSVSRGGGRTLSFYGVSVFETHAGLCHTYREYFDRAAALLAVGVSPEAVARVTARHPSVEVTTSDVRAVRA